MDRLVIGCSESYDVYVGQDECPQGGGRSAWAIPTSIGLSDREAVARAYRVWLWAEVKAGRIDPRDLLALHGKVLGVRSAEEGWHADVLSSATVWAMAEQARRLEEKLKDTVGRRLTRPLDKGRLLAARCTAVASTVPR